MKTEALITRLASGAGRFERRPIGRDLTLLTVTAMIACSLISVAVRGPVAPAMWFDAAMWTKLLYAASLTAGSTLLLRNMAFPGMPTKRSYRVVAFAFLCMFAIGLAAVARAPQGEKLHSVLGETALICPWAIPLLAAPALAGLLQLIKRFAPTEPRKAGAACGMLAGAIAAAAYALSCQETGIGFVAAWYSLGILLSAGVGAAVGERALRW